MHIYQAYPANFKDENNIFLSIIYIYIDIFYSSVVSFLNR